MLCRLATLLDERPIAFLDLTKDRLWSGRGRNTAPIIYQLEGVSRPSPRTGRTANFEPLMPQTAIDLAHLARQTGGDHDLERELLALFAQQCVHHLRTIHQAEDSRARMDAAHTLKGAARAVGAWQVAEAADAIEQRIAEADARRTEA
eukprot:gene15116-20449_t